MYTLNAWALSIIGLVVLIFTTMMFLASRYKRCPSDRILVVFGKVGAGQSAKCIHGGGVFVWPLIQDYSYMSLRPMTISIPLQKALSMQNIRINVPSTFTVGISTEQEIMTSAAERLLNLSGGQIEEMAKEIIFGQLRLTVASLTIEQINQDRESFLSSIRKNVEPELKKIGLYLINVNITDITDESGYIDSIGKKAAAEAINQAKIDVAEQEKFGAIGQAEATKVKEIRVAENTAESEKGQKKAEADRRVYVKHQEASAVAGENDALANIAKTNAGLTVQQAEASAESEKGQKKAEADRRVYVKHQEASAVTGENQALANIAKTNAELAVQQAEALKRGEVARREAEVEIQKAQYRAEQERLNAHEIVRQEIDKRKVEIASEAEAEKTRREAKGVADAVLLKYQAEAEGLLKVLESKASGYRSLVSSCNGDAKAAATLLMTEKIEQIVSLQVEAIRNIKIDKVTVWDNAGGKDGGTSTSQFMSGLIKSLPPLHEVAELAGIELPKYLGNIAEKKPSDSAVEE
ncbi:MAG: hypothetical protein LBB40_00415 [Holophagales bacterium]|jgi:flotillin|nr:hypothetical protein [Holophagales bacterium]